MDGLASDSFERFMRDMHQPVCTVKKNEPTSNAMKENVGPDRNVYARLLFAEQPEYRHGHVVSVQLQKPEAVLRDLHNRKQHMISKSTNKQVV